MIDAVVCFKNADRGATAIEYGLIAAGVALAIAGAVAVLGDNLAGTFGSVSDQLDPPATSDTGDANAAGTTSNQSEPQTINRDRGNVVVIPNR